MSIETGKEDLITDFQRIACEVPTLAEFGEQALPLLHRGFHASASLLYRCNEKGAAIPLAGTLVEDSPEYYSRFYLQDPIQETLQRSNSRLFHPPHVSEWKAYLKSEVYNDFQRPREVHHFVHFRIHKSRMDEPGAVCLLLARSPRQADFGKRELGFLSRMTPVLAGMARRSDLWETENLARACLEDILQRSSRVRMALDTRGGFLWASQGAEERLFSGREGAKIPLPALAQGARSLGALLRRKGGLPSPTVSVTLSRPGKEELRADLSLVRRPGGEYFVLVDFDDSRVSPLLGEATARFGLTHSETEVLGLLSLGLSDRQIGKRLFVSQPTVRSHVGHILDKMGARSRIQAVLLALGHRLADHSENL